MHVCMYAHHVANVEGRMDAAVRLEAIIVCGVAELVRGRQEARVGPARHEGEGLAQHLGMHACMHACMYVCMHAVMVCRKEKGSRGTSASASVMIMSTPHVMHL